MATRAPPAAPSRAPNIRPSAGATPSVSKNPGVTMAPSICAGSPACVSVKFAPKYADMPSKDALWRRQSSKFGYALTSLLYPCRRVVGPQHHQAIGRRVRERPQQDGTDDGEDGRVRADSEREREHRGSGKQRLLAEPADGVNEIALHENGAARARARPLRQLEERRRVQRIERHAPGVGVGRAVAHRRRVQVGEMTRQLVDDVHRELAPFAVGALPDQSLPLPQVAVTHTAPRRGPESARRTAAIPCAAPRAHRGLQA